MLKGPDFLCIGAQKAGTTWLYQHLKAHPAAWVPPIKELHYFDQRYIPETRSWTTEARRGKIEQAIKQLERRYTGDACQAAINAATVIQNFRETDEWYSSVFQCAPAGAVSGELTPEYSLLKKPQIIDIEETFKFKKVMMILRDPLDRAISEVRMLLSIGLVKSYEEALGPKWNVVEKSSYHLIYDIWKEALKSDRLNLFSYDRLASQPMSFLKDVCEFLEVDFSPNYFDGVDRVVFPGTLVPVPQNVLAELRQRIPRESYELYHDVNRELKS